MFCSNQYYEKPWDLRQEKPHIKTEGYFHSKDDRWNSLSHTSPKQAAFFLTTNSEPIFLSSTVPPDPSHKEEGSLPQRTFISQNRLTRRTLERELLQLKSSQRVLISEPNSPPEADHLDRFTDFKNPSHNGTLNVLSAWGKLNDQPGERVRLTLTQKVVERDQKAIETISGAIDREKETEAARVSWFQKNRKKIQHKLQAKRLDNQEKEARAGVHKAKAESSYADAVTSNRIIELSQPHHPAEMHLRSEFTGLVLVDYAEATQSAYRKPPQIPTSRYSRSNKKFFPLPETLGSARFTVLDSRPHTQSRPTTVRTQSALVIQKPKDTIGDEMMSKAEVLESLKEIDDFDHRVKESTVAFSKIHFATFRDSNNKPR